MNTSQPGPASGNHVLAGHFNNPDTYVTKRPVGINDWIITYTLDGKGYYLVGNQERTVQAGDVAIIQSGAPHQYGTYRGKHWHFVWAHFSSRILETRLLPNEPLFIHHVDNDSAQRRIFHCFEVILSDSLGRGAYWNELCENRLREVLLLLVQRTNQRLDPRIQETLHWLTLHLTEPLQIRDIAKKVGLSSSRLSHLFKQNTGYSIIDYFNRIRIRQATLLFENTDRNAAEVARDVGYVNYNHFANQFRKIHGASPREYQRNM